MKPVGHQKASFSRVKVVDAKMPAQYPLERRLIDFATEILITTGQMQDGRVREIW